MLGRPNMMRGRLDGKEVDVIVQPYAAPDPHIHLAQGRYANGFNLDGIIQDDPRSLDPDDVWRTIEREKIVTLSIVGDAFARPLLDQLQRGKYDVSSLRCAIHAAAPCPIPTKEKMIEWWGPIVWEYYAGTEGPGSTMVGSEEWLARPGTVGRCAGGVIHILDDEFRELPAGQAGTIYFETATASGFQERMSAS